MSLMYPVRSHLLRLSYALMYILRLATRPRFFARLYVRLIYMYINIYIYIHTYAACVCVIPRRHARTYYTYTERKRRVFVYTRTTRREIRIIGSNDGSRGTGAGKSQRLSLLVAHPLLFLFFSFPSFCRNVNPTKQKQRGVHRSPRDPCFRRPRTRSRRSPFLRPSDCSVYCTSTDDPPG